MQKDVSDHVINIYEYEGLISHGYTAETFQPTVFSYCILIGHYERSDVFLATAFHTVIVRFRFGNISDTWLYPTFKYRVSSNKYCI